MKYYMAWPLDNLSKAHKTTINYLDSHIWPPLVAIFLALRVWEAFGASWYL